MASARSGRVARVTGVVPTAAARRAPYPEGARCRRERERRVVALRTAEDAGRPRIGPDTPRTLPGAPRARSPAGGGAPSPQDRFVDERQDSDVQRVAAGSRLPRKSL